MPTCRHMCAGSLAGDWSLTDSLHCSYDRCLYLLGLLQCRDSSSLQFTRWNSTTQLQQHTAGCISGNEHIHTSVRSRSLRYTMCRSYTQFLLTCCYLMPLFTPQDTSTACNEREKRCIPYSSLTADIRNKRCFWDILTWSWLPPWQ